MPTGYTAKLVEGGQTFREFALSCARCFGALIHLRDEPFDAPVPDEIPVPEYYANWVSEAREGLAALEGLTPEQGEAWAVAEITRRVEGYREAIKEREAANARIDAMDNEVAEWEPPTEEHASLKKFMRDQLAMSRDSTEYHDKAIAELEGSLPSDYFTGQLAERRDRLERATKNLEETTERAASATRWIKGLKESLPA